MNGDFARLQTLIEGDDALRQRLWEMTDAHAFVGAIVDLARERGLHVLPDEIWHAYHEGRAAWLAMWNP